MMRETMEPVFVLRSKKCCRIPACTLVLITGLSLAVLAICIDLAWYYSSVPQIHEAYDKNVALLQDRIQVQVREHFHSMKQAAYTLQNVEPLMRVDNMPEDGGYNPQQIIATMNSFPGLQQLTGLGIMIKEDFAPTANEKISWEIDLGFGCPEYIYAFVDKSIHPRFYGQCAFKDGYIDPTIVYNGTDYGLSVEESQVLAGTYDEIFKPIFDLFGHFLITFVAGHKSMVNPGVIYGLTFSQKSLLLLDIFMSRIPLGETGIAYILEANTGLIVTSSVANQTRTSSEHGSHRVHATEASDKKIAKSAQILSSKLGGFDKIDEEEEIDQDGYLIVASEYEEPGLHWIVVIVSDRDEYYGNVENYAAIGIATSVVCSVVIGIISILAQACFVTRPLAKHNRNLQRLANLEFDQVEKAGYTPLREVDDIQESTEMLKSKMQHKQMDDV